MTGYSGEKGLVKTAKPGRTGMGAAGLVFASEAVQKFVTVSKLAGPSHNHMLRMKVEWKCAKTMTVFYRNANKLKENQPAEFQIILA